MAGCLLGGAVGDALGAPVEFLSLGEIRDRFGPGGVRDYTPAYGGTGAVTDDTQMTLFTAEAVLRAHNRRVTGGRADLVGALHRAYLRWDYTQRTVWPATAPARSDTSGWLLRQPFLHHPRAPGRTCLSALRADRRGTRADPLNHSKGCGGVMRVAPLGLALAEPFAVAVEAAALTHGHPSGFLPAGALALIVAALCRGVTLHRATELALDELLAWPRHEETSRALRRALDLVEAAVPGPDTVESLGGGWTGEEALAIAVYCALATPDFHSGIVLAVNHGGDSDSTGALAGHLLGCVHGLGGIPRGFLDGLEGREVIEQVAADLDLLLTAGDAPVDLDRYPPD